MSVFADLQRSDSQVKKVAFFAKTNTLPSTIELVLNDMGIALLPEFSLKKYLAKGDLVRVLPDFQGRHWPFYLVHRFSGDKPIHITRFHQLVKYFFAKANAGFAG